VTKQHGVQYKYKHALNNHSVFGVSKLENLVYNLMKIVLLYNNQSLSQDTGV